jgi:hypothetical protein
MGFLLLLLLQIHPSETKGDISYLGTAMPVVDALAVWDPTAHTLSIALMPFKIEKEHIEEIQKDRDQFVSEAHKTPDATKWPTWCPSAQMVLVCLPSATLHSLTTESIRETIFRGYRISLKGGGFASTRGAPEGLEHVKKLAIKKDSKNQFSVEFVYSAEDGPRENDDKYDIVSNFSVTCSVLPAIKDKK